MQLARQYLFPAGAWVQALAAPGGPHYSLRRAGLERVACPHGCPGSGSRGAWAKLKLESSWAKGAGTEPE
ncbi:hypothetical protein NDU88_007154 [Pleurodeles waltl]|uniref:Uncharacterized protein n=1 Tax=Pleurodeles waltl TaxID=8319 RepID=A0AAV7TZK9_PLEWA|nr:hypothetical protein NDU88_007154 [Pleurodeles waltl]